MTNFTSDFVRCESVERVLRALTLVALAAAMILIAAQPAFAASCDCLSALKLPDTTITSAQVVAAGAFEAPAGPQPAAFKELPAFCRVSAEIKPAKESDLKTLWLPR